MSLEALPVETLDEIVTSLDSRADLVNLCSVSRILNPIITERHLDYRDIRCRLDMDNVWEHLINNPSLAKNVRRLELQPDGGMMDIWPSPIRVPKLLRPTEQPKLESYEMPSIYLDRDRRFETLLISTLKNMSNLSSFKWNRFPPLFDTRAGIGSEDIWTALRTYTALRELDVIDDSETNTVHSSHLDPAIYGYIRPIWDTAIFDLSGLTSFMIQTNTYNDADFEEEIDVSRLSNMLLSNCPDLEVLSLSFILDNSNLAFNAAEHDDLFRSAHWPRLRSLSLSSIYISPELAVAFVLRHPYLEFLRIDAVESNPFTALPYGALPRLATLICDLSFAVPIIQALAEPRVLRTFISTSDTARPPVRAEFINLLGTLLHLERLQFIDRSVFVDAINLEDIRRIAAQAPNLNWLTIGRHSDFTDEGKQEWIDAFALFPKLSTIHGFEFILEKPSDKDDSKLLRLLSQLPSLRRVDVWKDVWVPPFGSGPTIPGIQTPVVMLKLDETRQTVTWEGKETFSERIPM